jgi:hypothetical protein
MVTSCLMLLDCCGELRPGERRNAIFSDFPCKMQVFFRTPGYGADTESNRTGPSTPDGRSGESAL